MCCHCLKLLQMYNKLMEIADETLSICNSSFKFMCSILGIVPAALMKPQYFTTMPNRAKVARFMRIAAAAASAIASARCFAVSHSKCTSMKLEQHHVSTRHFGQSSSHVESCVICFQGPFPRQMICHQYLILLQELRRIEPVATA